MRRVGVVLVVLGVGLFSSSARATQVVEAPCPLPSLADGRATFGCFIPEADTIYVDPRLPRYVRRGVVRHEWGHAFDYHYLDDVKRTRIERLMRWSRWRPEHFADQFAGCHLDNQTRHKAFPFAVTRDRRASLCRLLPKLR